MSAFVPSHEEESARTEENDEEIDYGRNAPTVKNESENGEGGGNGDPVSASVCREGSSNNGSKDEERVLEEMAIANREGSSGDSVKDEVENLEVVNREGLSYDNAKDERKTLEEAVNIEGRVSSYDDGRKTIGEVITGQSESSSYGGEDEGRRSSYEDRKDGEKTSEKVRSIDCEDPSYDCEEDGRKTLTLDELERILMDMESKFAPFVRHDIYGRMGKENIPISERIRLFVAFGTIVPLRAVLLLAIVILGYTICRICTLFIPPDQIGENNGEIKHHPEVKISYESQENYANLCGWHRAVIVLTGRVLSRVFLFVLGFYWIRVINIEDDFKGQSGLRPAAVISNHVSYIDILYHISAVFPSFAPKRSVADLPIIGLISKCLGCVFVQREEKPSDFKGVSGIIWKRMQDAAKDKNVPLMMLFPEGTTTNGFYLLPFKTGAFLAGTPIQPVILRYPYIHFSPAWETISGVRHFFLLLCQFINYLEVLWLPVYFPSEIERADPRLYARNVRKLMAVEGGLFLSEVGLQEKRIYHSFLNEYIFQSS